MRVSIESVIADLRGLHQNQKQGILGYVDGRIYADEITTEQRKKIQDFLTTIRDFLKSSEVSIVGCLPETSHEKTAKLLLETCGTEAISPLLVAKEQVAALFSDDSIVRSIGRLNNRVTGFCTQAFLRVAVERNLLTPAQYQDAIVKLIESNYTFVSEDSGTLKRIYECNGGRVTQLAKTVINRVNDPNWNSTSCLPLLAEFCLYVWRDSPPEGGDLREVWIEEIWTAIVKARNGEMLALEFQGKLAVVCLAQPGAFSAIVTYAIRNVTVISRHRVIHYETMQQSIKSVARVMAQAHPYWPELSRQWIQQGRVNQILKRNGWLE